VYSRRGPHQIRRGRYLPRNDAREVRADGALFRGEAKLAYDHSGRRCTIQGRGVDGRGASRANASGTVEATGGDTTLLKVEGNFNVTGPLETFANAGGAHLARAILAEFAENVAKLVAEQAGEATAPAMKTCRNE
jgi:uncharacterized protein